MDIDRKVGLYSVQLINTEAFKNIVYLYQNLHKGAIRRVGNSLLIAHHPPLVVSLRKSYTASIKNGVIEVPEKYKEEINQVEQVKITLVKKERTAKTGIIAKLIKNPIANIATG